MEQNTTIDEDRIEDGIVNDDAGDRLQLGLRDVTEDGIVNDDAGDRVLTNDKIDYKAL